MFKIVPNPEFRRTVPVTLPDGSSAELETTFRAVDEEEFETFTKEATREAAEHWLGLVVRSFHDVEDADGQTFKNVDPGHMTFGWLLKQPYIRTALIAEYHNAMAGLKGPRRGN